jgi:hypothetical protein
MCCPMPPLRPPHRGPVKIEGVNAEAGLQILKKVSRNCSRNLSTSKRFRDIQGKNADARVLYLHHHPFSPMANMELHDAAALRETIKGKNVDILLFGHNHNGWKWNGWWDIKRCYDAGTSTRKEGSAGYHRIMDPGKDHSTDYDGDFLGNLKSFIV